ncbi:NUDIX domain-containing protein [Catenulispora yoronensis]|uniref:NUDIX domain-containing protein n=1 Tax=Catenulispora yoronensis TaxID=450799 RepID=A0ABP5F6P6_9ACTN
MPEHYRHSVSVAGVVVRDDGKILVIRRADNGQIQAPGGILEQEEAIEAGLVREVLEETGYQVRPQRLTGVYKNMVLGVVALVYRCELIGGSATPNSEAKEILWLDRQEVENSAVEAFSVRITDALDGDWPAVRSHDGTKLVS